jgi:hypothetical protein
LTDTHDEIELMERLIDEAGLTRDTPPALRDERLAELRAEAARRITDPDRRDAALQYLEHWRRQP